MAGRLGVTILWASVAPSASLPRPGGVAAVTVAEITGDGISAAISAALIRGAVLVVVDSDQDSHRALALGADEVLRAAELDEQRVTSTIERAELRAAIRFVARVPRAADLDDAGALQLIASSMGQHMNSPLGAAALRCEVLRAAMSAITGLADAFAQTAATATELPASERHRVVALRAAAPPSVALEETVDGLALAVRDASRIMQQVCTFLTETPADEPIDVVEVTRDVAAFVAVVVERSSCFRVELPDARYLASFGRWHLVQVIAALINNSLQALADRGIRGTITLRVVPVDEAIAIEVLDDGIGMSPEVQQRALEPFFTTRASPAAGLGLAIVTERVRRAGGDIVIESERDRGTRVSLFFPLVSAPRAAGRLN